MSIPTSKNLFTHSAQQCIFRKRITKIKQGPRQKSITIPREAAAQYQMTSHQHATSTTTEMTSSAMTSYLAPCDVGVGKRDRPKLRLIHLRLILLRLSGRPGGFASLDVPKQEERNLNLSTAISCHWQSPGSKANAVGYAQNIEYAQLKAGVSKSMISRSKLMQTKKDWCETTAFQFYTQLHQRLSMILVPQSDSFKQFAQPQPSVAECARRESRSTLFYVTSTRVAKSASV